MSRVMGNSCLKPDAIFLYPLLCCAEMQPDFSFFRVRALFSAFISRVGRGARALIGVWWWLSAALAVRSVTKTVFFFCGAMFCAAGEPTAVALRRLLRVSHELPVGDLSLMSWGNCQKQTHSLT